jgi:hypothetical protein
MRLRLLFGLLFAFSFAVPISLPASAAHPSLVAEQQVSVYITRTGKKYHRAGCRYLSRSMIRISLADAVRFYGPCSVCRPPSN